MNAIPNNPRHPIPVAALLRELGIQAPRCVAPDQVLCGLTDDSRQVVEGGAFVAVRGEVADGHNYIEHALRAGAALVVAECIPEGVDPSRIATVADSRVALAALGKQWYGDPTAQMSVWGVTGTNGKTTVAYLMEAILDAASRRPALLGTIEYRYEDLRETAPTTTPGLLHLLGFLATAHSRGARSAAMEVSSHALAQKRVEGIRFDVAAITNITQDHLDYHGSMEAYAQAKQLLFTHHAPRHAVFNFDDLTCRRFAEEHRGEAWTFSLDPVAATDVSARSLEMDATGIRMGLALSRARGGDKVTVRSALLGRFNASNLAAAFTCAAAAGIDAQLAADALSRAAGPPGRLERIDEGQNFGVYVDYAHTPDAVERVLENVRAVTTGRVIAVLGCGGDRDAGKRPLMGEAAGRLADYTVIANDNPRGEDPAQIAQAIEEGIRQSAAPGAWEVCLDRAEAIRQAVAFAQKGDTVVIAGKGHEDYQVIGAERRHFDDREQARQAINSLRGDGKGE